MTGLEGIQQTQKHDKRGCKDCIYLSSSEWCDYREMTGRSRLVDGGPLHPDGGCSLHKRGKRVVASKSPWYGYERRKKLDEIEGQLVYRKPTRRQRIGEHDAEIERYYNMGLIDRKVAEMVGCSKSSVLRWRKRNGLQPNFKLDREKAEKNGEEV